MLLDLNNTMTSANNFQVLDPLLHTLQILILASKPSNGREKYILTSTRQVRTIPLSPADK